MKKGGGIRQSKKMKNMKWLNKRNNTDMEGRYDILFNIFCCRAVKYLFDPPFEALIIATRKLMSDLNNEIIGSTAL